MAVTTRDYPLTTSRPKDVINALESALADLDWFEPTPYGYLTTFTNTPGSTLKNKANERYLVSPSSTTAANGAGAVFDVLRSPVGAISAVTLVTGGSGYYVRGIISASSSGTTVTVASTTGINPGMLVTKLTGGTGALQTNTVVVSVIDSTTFTIDQTPTTPLSGANILLSDLLVLGASDIGGSTYTSSATGTSGQSTIVVSDVTNVFIGQRVTGNNIGSLATVTAISGTTVTLSKANAGTVNSQITFSDEILVTTTGIVNMENITGTASGLTITNVSTNANLYVGAEVELVSGTPTWDNSNGRVIIGSITGSGPYTVTLRNEENTFKGFTSSGSITFNVSSGSNVGWFDVDCFTAPQTYCWAVAKIKNSNDRLGNTFWLFYAGTNTTLYNGVNLLIRPLSGYNCITNIAQGVTGLDNLVTPATTITAMHGVMTIASSSFASTTLRTRQSSVDSNFATFAFFEGNNNRNPFFLSKYSTATMPWTNYNDVWLGGVTEIFQLPVFNTSDCGILFRTRGNVPKRMAEAGYGNYNIAVAVAYTNTYFRTTTGNRIFATPAAAYDDIALYSRQTGDIQTSVTTTYPIYKNIPVNPYYMPVPYYLPEEFVLIELPWLNAAIKDTVTVNENEVYTILQVATNQTTLTSLAFAARTT
jgi:hypothetical protein